MKEAIEALKALLANPDDLSGLPQTIARLEEYQKNVASREAEDLDRITRLQDANRNLLSQIPVSTGEPEPEGEPEAPTFEKAKEELVKIMQNIGGN